ncbi:MAG: Zn-dependent hydrolase, partial [Gammaproteobacteria bacterium]|nr:Zn-dependent hydrolase [Gammaproteobacteria bacterium]
MPSRYNPMMPCLWCFTLICLSIFPAPTQAQEKPSTCLSIANALPNVIFASLTSDTLSPYQVRITFKGHSTYLIQSASGVSIATDYSGFIDSDVPRVVTMNHAHDTHYTEYPDPGIEHV